MILKINLLGRSNEFYTKKIYYFKMQLLLFLGITTLILLSWHILLQSKINLNAQQANYLQKQLNYVVKQIKDGYQIQDQQELQQQIMHQIIGLDKQRIEFSRVFQSLHQSLPTNIYLTQLVVKNHEVKMLGKTRTLAELTQFVINLTKAKGNKVVAIQKINKQNDRYNFVLLYS